MADRKSEGDLTRRILVEIRDEMRAMRIELGARIDATNGEMRAMRTELSARIDTTNERVDRLEHRHAEDSVRLATEVVAVAHAVREVRDLLREQKIDREQFEDHEQRITALEARRT